MDTRLVPVEEVQRLGFDFLRAAVEQLVPQYCAIMGSLYGYALQPEDVRFKVNGVELAWDVCSPEGATPATHRFESAWNRWFASPTHVFETPRLQRGLASGELKSVGKEGQILKLYAKGWDFLRFEAQLSQKHIKRLVGHSANPADHEGFRATLNEVADRIFPELLGVQAEVGESTAVSLLAVAFAAGPSKHASRIVGPLLMNGSVKIYARDSAGREVLEKLRRHGHVQIGKGKGVWVLTRLTAHLPSAIRRVDKITAAEAAS